MFDTALIESGGHHGDHATVRKLPFAIGFHAAVIGALISSALISTAEPPEPVIPIAFPSFTGGPPPPPEGSGPKPIPAVIHPRPIPVDTPPVTIPDNPPDSAAEPSVSAALDDTGSGDNSSGNGEPGGQKYGVPGGDPYSTETGEDSGTETDGRSILTPGVGGVTIPELLERVDPAYPDTARKLRQEGTVLLEAVITASGAVDEIRVVASRGPLLDSAAIAAVRRWRYRPATLNGRAVAVFLTVRVTFGLSG